MLGLQELFESPMGKQLVQGISRETGAQEQKTSEVLGMALPVLMGAMKKNVQSPQGAEGLLNALNNRHTGDILENLGSFFAGGVDPEVKKEGEGILGHVLGSKQPEVENALSQRSGLNPDAIANMLKVAAPVLMGMLGRQRAQAGVSDSSGLNNLLGGMLGGQSSQSIEMITNLIDSDGDGSILDDVTDFMSGGGSRKSGGLGGLLGGLFGK